MDTRTNRVKRGIALLDSYHGREEWQKRLDLETFDLSDCSACVLGQVFGDYGVGCGTLWGDHDGSIDTYVSSVQHQRESIAHGFELSNDYDEDYRTLEEVWVKELVAMDIGKEKHTITVEPIENPVPDKVPEPTREPRTVPRKEPVEAPEKPAPVPVKK